MSGLELVFWITAAALAYLYVGYPLAIAAWASAFGREPKRDRSPRSVSVVVVAHNEESLIEQRIRNVFALDYPRESVEVVLASDGSTDSTVERARAGAPFPGLRVVEFSARLGKPAALNRVIPRCTGEIVVLADARQRFGSDALRALVAPFADTEVGAVSGELVLLPRYASGDEIAGVGAGFYWHYEKWIRMHESRVDSTVGTTGAIYAIRRSLFRPIPEDTVLDDVLIPMNIVRQGYRVLFEPAAKAYDHVPPSSAHELVRKVRTIAGNLQLFAREHWLMDPRQNRLWIQSLSHKMLRLASPWMLLVLLLANAALATSPLYAGLLALQCTFYASACGAIVLRAHLGGRSLPTVLAAPYAICLLNWATALAFLRFARGGLAVTWDRAGAVEEARLASSSRRHGSNEP